MKLFRDIKKWFDNQEHLFYLFLVILIVPNVVLCFTEPISWTAKICNILLPLSIYYAVMAWSRNCGRTFWLLFPFIFFGAFQLVLLYLFGQSIIAVDMFLNLVTTNSSEALELLDNLIPAIVIVVVLYIPALILATISIVHKRRLSEAFIRQARRRTLYVLSAGILSLGTAYLIRIKLGSVGEMPCLKAFSMREIKMSGAISVRLSGRTSIFVSTRTLAERRMRISSM